MDYMAAAYVRTPKSRELASRVVDRQLKALIAAWLQEDASVEAVLKRLPAAVRNAEGFDPAALREFAQDPGRYTVSLDRNWQVGLPLGALVPIARQALLPRQWLVMRAGPNEHLVTSDSPLTFFPAGPVDGTTLRIHSPDTLALFPVDRHRVLIGRGQLAARRDVVPRGVASVNGATLLHSHRHVFAEGPDFAWENDIGHICGSRDYLLLGPPGPNPAAELGRHREPPKIT